VKNYVAGKPGFPETGGLRSLLIAHDQAGCVTLAEKAPLEFRTHSDGSALPTWYDVFEYSFKSMLMRGNLLMPTVPEIV